ncbi:mucin-19-like [Stegastes partitus]|uniref:Mucin-19-like n=2 Tax=Stegastes partitus TaxID=144197 RepID=A0A9Y4NQK4_9TELE|nr:PREDICTED: mucin-19-like [Stegastes partitus]
MNYPNSVAVLRECMKNESLVRFFQERQTTLNHSLPLETYLLKPVQRILKYHLLLQVRLQILPDTACRTSDSDFSYRYHLKNHQILHCCNLLLVETLKDPLCFRVSDQTIPKQQHVVQTKNQEEKRLWVHYLKRLIVENHPASLPQKARQVLGDNFCQTPQFDHEHLKKSSASPRLDDIHGFHRGRRQSEPPELLMFTPEKSRKSLPLLLEGNLPYRRSRRQSAPAKDIEAAFHPNALKPAGSEGELCHADSLGSAGSSSTLASSVIEVETERDEPTPQLRTNREEEEEEELTPLSPPPTLSITEEILEFINQSRAREGLSAIHSDTSDQPKESLSPSTQTNFTCPLPPVTCPSSPEQTPTMQQEQEQTEVEADVTLHSQIGENEANNIQEIPDATSQVKKGAEVTQEEEEEKEKEVVEEDKQEMKASDDEDKPQTSDLHPSISVEEETENSTPREEANTDSSPDHLHQPVQTRQPPKRGSHLTKRDKKIIEKIRSYYEAAAEAEEDDEAEEEDELREGGVSRRRNSFSQIPSGWVKESVSRFDVSGHQGEPEVGGSICEATEASDREPSSSTSPTSPMTPILADLESDELADKPVSGLDFDAEGPIKSTVTQDEETKHQEGPEQESNKDRPVGEEIQDGKAYNGSSEEGLEEGPEGTTSVSGEQKGPSVTKQCKDEATKTGAATQELMNGHEPNQAEPNRSHKEPAKQSAEQGQKPDTKTTWAKTKNLAKTSGNLEGLPSQIKVGRWSRHSRIVTANRALFEGMGSDVAGIGLFEASPAVDPVLIENSERILSKVQTIARMYSAKASTMKVPLHQKRASTVWNQSWVSTRLSGLSAQSQTKYQQQTQITQSETKSGTQTHSETKAQSQTVTQQLKIQNKTQNKTRTYSQTQSVSWEGQRIREEKTIKTAESLTHDFQETVMEPCEPLLFGHVVVKEQLTPTCQQQTNGFTLSRPRDFISALTRDSIVEASQTSTSLLESPSTETSWTSAASKHPLRAEPEDQSTSLCSSTSSNLLTSNQNVHLVPEVTPTTEGSEQSPVCVVYSAGEDPTSARVTEQPNLSALNPQRKRDEQEPAAAQHIQEQKLSKDVRVCAGETRIQAEDRTSMALHPAPGGVQPQREAPLWADGAAAAPERPQRDEPLSGTLNHSSGSLRSVQTEDPPDSSGELNQPSYRSSEASLGASETPEDPKTKEVQNPESHPFLPRPPSVQPEDLLPTFTSQRPADLPTALSKRASCESWRVDCELRKPKDPILVERPTPATATPDRDLTVAPSAFKPSLQQRSPSPLRATSSPHPPSSSVRAPPCSSPFRVIPASSPTPVSPGGSTYSMALSCLSPTPPSSGKVSSTRAPPASSPTPSTRSSRTGAPSSPTPSTSLRSPPCSSPVASSSAFTRSLAASCISQSISQSMAKTNSTTRQQATPTNPSHLRQRSPSPHLPPSQQGSTTPAYAQLGCTKDGYQHPRCLSQRSPSPSMANHQPPYSPSSTPRPSFLHSKTDHNTNNNNNVAGSSTVINGAVSNGGWSTSPQKGPQTHDALWLGSHNRVARPFSASEPSSRVQSPSPSPTPASFTRLCSPPPQHNYSSPMANKPPHPRSTRIGSSHNPLGLTLELPRPSSSCLSPRILSPPPIGVSVNVWTNNVAAPQPRNPRYASSSSSPSFSSMLGSPTLDTASSSFVPRSSSRASSPSGSCPPSSQSLRRSFSSGLADNPSSPAQATGSGLRRSWAEGSRRTFGFSGRSSFDQQESCPISPRSGWSSYSSSPSCLSPRAGLQSPISPSRFTPGKGNLGGQHFTSVPWPDVRELSNKYKITDSPDTSATSTIVASPPAPISPLSHTPLTSPGPSEWGDPELEQGHCRSQLICAYVARPSREQNLPSSGITSPPPATHHHQSQVRPQPQVLIATTTPHVSSVPPTFPSAPSPLPFSHSSPTKQGNQKASYATTVNLQIAGSGRITSFSTAQVSLTQTLQGGAGAGGPGQGQMTRRVSINGLSHLPPPLSQNCNRL